MRYLNPSVYQPLLLWQCKSPDKTVVSSKVRVLIKGCNSLFSERKYLFSLYERFGPARQSSKFSHQR